MEGYGMAAQTTSQGKRVKPIRLGIDIGGTFTDLFAYNESTGEIFITKSLSTPPDFVEGVMNAIKKVNIDLSLVHDFIAHGSTIADNAIIERKIPRIALLTTEGFRDLIFLGRLHRERLYDLQWDRPSQFRPIIRRRDIYEVRERIGSSGEVIIPLDKEYVERIAREIIGKYDAYAICYINSYVNEIHEKETKQILLKAAKEKGYDRVYVTASHEVLKTIRELPRLSTTLMNAILMPIMASYLQNLKNRLALEGFNGDILLFQSNGGVVSAEAAMQKPVYVMTSGPVAGVIASMAFAKLYGLEKVLSFDMGGTTAKASTIVDGSPFITTEFQFEWDLPIAVPMVEMSEVGTGGGSIAWVDVGGMLKVGPISAGSIPGPACYGRGGVEPTIVDAQVVLHRLNPEAVLGGEVKIRKENAIKAIREKICEKLGLEVFEAARGIIGIANTSMAEACKKVTLRKGYDTREFVMIAFGGAGPMHACEIAEELGIRKIIVPIYPGVFSSLGMCLSDLMQDELSTILRTLDEIDINELNDLISQLEGKVMSQLLKQGVKTIETISYAKMRYIGEAIGKELTILLKTGKSPIVNLQDCRERFEKLHYDMYGFNVPGEKIVLTDLIVRGVGFISKPAFREYPLHEPQDIPQEAVVGEREVYFSETNAFEKVRVYKRERLKSGNLICGPTVIEEETSTIIVPPHWQAYIDKYRNVVISKEE
jgi:N-methylhydantoinase A